MEYTLFHTKIYSLTVFCIRDEKGSARARKLDQGLRFYAILQAPGGLGFKNSFILFFIN